jgi:ornithine cyclodeaminase
VSLRVLTADQVREALPMPLAIEAMGRAAAQLSAGRATMPLRTVLPTAHGTTLVMPAWLADAEELAVKVVGVHDGNPARGLPRIVGLVTVFDPQTGAPRAVMDAAALTALRTGAGGGLAADLLARPDVTDVALIGAGVQARSQLEALLAVRPIQRVRVFARRRAATEAFAASVRAAWPELSVHVASSPAEAVRGAGLVVAATTSVVPVFDDADLAPGAHVTGVGSWQPTQQEIPWQTVARARVFADQREAAWAEAGDLVVPLGEGRLGRDPLAGALGEVVLGRVVGRQDAAQITFFKSVGLAVQDAAAGAAVLRAAEARGLGTVVDFP